MSEVGDGIADLVEAFDCEGRDEETGFEGLEGGGAVWWEGEMGWVSGLKAGQEVNLGECESDGLGMSASSG